jgi:Prokaryotic phospholipase A2
MAADPTALYEYARVNEAAATALESIVFPTIGSWHGVAGQVFQARLAALAKRRDELKDAHVRAGAVLRVFAVVAEQTQEEMRFRQSLRAEAVDRRARIDAVSSHTSDPMELQRLQHVRDVCEHDIRMADRAYARADKTFQSAEKKCARDIEHLANLREMEPLAERVGQLSLADFVAYKALVKAQTIPTEGLNWTSDGCSDGGAVTGNVDLAACELHDFDYRNHDRTRDPWWLDKQKADARLAQEMARDAATNTGVPGILLGGPTQIATDLGRVGLVWLGAEVLGRPDATTSDERKKGKTKSRDK